MLRFTNTADITSHDANILIVQANICFLKIKNIGKWVETSKFRTPVVMSRS